MLRTYHVYTHQYEHMYVNPRAGVAQQIVHVISSSEVPDVYAQMALLGVARLSTEVNYVSLDRCLYKTM